MFSTTSRESLPPTKQQHEDHQHQQPLLKDLANVDEAAHHRVDLNEPGSRNFNNFKVFSPNEIKSSLTKKSSVKRVPSPTRLPDTNFNQNNPPLTDGGYNDERLEILIQENDNLLQERIMQAQEVEGLTRELQSTNRKFNNVENDLNDANEEVASLQRHLDEIGEAKKIAERQVKLGIEDSNSKSAEIDHLNGLMAKNQSEFRLIFEKNQELVQIVNDISERYKDVVREASHASKREKELLQEIESKGEELEQAQCKVAEDAKMFEAVKDQLDTQLAITQNLQRKMELVEKKELSLLEQSQIQSQQVEEALYQKDSASRREELLLKEIDSLTQKCLNQPKLYKEKNDLAIQSLRTQFTIERRHFVDETQKLEELCTSLQSQIERALREKRAAESELEKMTRHLPGEADRMSMALDEMHSKLCASERERHEAVSKLESNHQKMMREQNQHESERHQANDRAEDMYRRLKRAEREIEDSKNAGLQMQETISALEHEKKSALEQVRTLTSSFESQIKINEGKTDSRISELSAKLENVTEAHSATCRDMQRLLSTQRAMGDKWKDESELIKVHYEVELTKLKKQIAQYQTRCGELEKAIQKGAAQRRDLIDQVTIEKHQNEHYQGKNYQLQTEKEEMGRQVANLLAKEVELIDERKKLARQLDKALLEKEQRKREEAKHTAKPRILSIMSEINRDQTSTSQSIDQKMTQQLEQDIERITKRTKKRVPKAVAGDADISE